MNRFRIPIQVCLIVVALAALDLLAVRQVIQNRREERVSRLILLNALPMFNLLAILGHRLIRQGVRRQPFVAGFFGGGLVAMLGSLLILLALPISEPWTDQGVGTPVEAWSDRVGSLIVLIGSFPQFLVGLAVGVVVLDRLDWQPRSRESE